MPTKKNATPADVLRAECPEGINKLNRKDYINHIGLVYLAGKGDPWSADTEVLDVEKTPDGLPAYVLTKTTITVHGDPVRTYSGIGDATAENTGIAKTALPRMAETRSCNRALRLYLGAPDTTAEEMPGEEGPAFSRVAELQKLREVTATQMASGQWTAEQCTAAMAAQGVQGAGAMGPSQLVELRTIIETLTGHEWTERNKQA